LAVFSNVPGFCWSSEQKKFWIFLSSSLLGTIFPQNPQDLSTPNGTKNNQYEKIKQHNKQQNCNKKKEEKKTVTVF